jgi:hypothetical protein
MRRRLCGAPGSHTRKIVRSTATIINTKNDKAHAFLLGVGMRFII